MERLESARPEDRLAQPLQAEREQEEADHEPERVDRHLVQSRAECGDDRRQRDSRGADPDERRAPAPGDADREYDRQRLDHLHGARQKGGSEEEDGAHATRLLAGHVASAEGRVRDREGNRDEDR